MFEKSRRQLIADQFRAMKVGEVIQFPFAEYNPNTIRSTPSGALLKEKSEGWSWRTRQNMKDKCIDVIRLS